jgi:hypothetical protein
MGEWEELVVSRTCRVLLVRHNAPLGLQGCEGTLPCTGPRSATALSELLSRADVKKAFARDADHGARAASSRDLTALHVEHEGHAIGVDGACSETWRCRHVPAAVLELLTFGDSVGRLPDGGFWSRPPLCE